MTEHDGPEWVDDPDDPRHRAVQQIADMTVERLDRGDALEMLMRWEAGTVALYVSIETGCVLIDTLDAVIDIRDAGPS